MNEKDHALNEQRLNKMMADLDQQSLNGQRLNEKHRTPFIAALKEKSWDLALTMLPEANVWGCDESGNLPWLIACDAGAAGVMRAICKAMQATPRGRKRDAWIQPPLSRRMGIRPGADVSALDAESIIVLRVELEFASDHHLEQKSGWSPLLVACEKGKEDCVKTLLEFGGSPEMPEACGAALLACTNDHPGVLAALLNAKPALMKGFDAEEGGGSMLHVAAHYGSVACINLLLKKGLDPAQGNHIGDTPLMLAARAQKPEAVRVLMPVSHVWERNIKGTLALGNAVSADCPKSVILILEQMEKTADDDVIFLAEICCALGETRNGLSPQVGAVLEDRVRVARESLALRLELAEHSARKNRVPKRTL